MSDFSSLGVQKIDHVEFAVAELQPALDLFYRLGFEQVQSREIRERQAQSHLLILGNARVLLTRSTLPSDPVAAFVSNHGDGLFNIGLLCGDAVSALELATKRGAEALDPPKAYKKDFGEAQRASIRAFGSVRFTFISRQGTLFGEGFEAPMRADPSEGISEIDHFVPTVSADEQPGLAKCLEQVLGLGKLSQSNSPRYFSEVYVGGDPGLRVPVLTPSALNPAREFLERNLGSGIQSLGLRTQNLEATLAQLKPRGISFVPVPAAYYEALPARGLGSEKRYTACLDAGAMIDTEADGAYLHAVTQPMVGPFRFQLLERQNAHGVGENSFLALARAVERERSASRIP